LRGRRTGLKTGHYKDENGLTFKFHYAPSDVMYTDIIVTMLPTSETTSSLETNVSQGGFLSSDVAGGRRGKEDAEYFVMQLRERLMDTPSDRSSKQCYAASLTATTAAALKVARQTGLLPRGERLEQSFFFFSKQDAVNKIDVSLETFQETRSLSCVQMWSERHKKGGAAWFHKREQETSSFPEFFELVRRELLPAPAVLLRNLLIEKTSELRDGR
jgi:hypothetical protein